MTIQLSGTARANRAQGILNALGNSGNLTLNLYSGPPPLAVASALNPSNNNLLAQGSFPASQMSVNGGTLSLGSVSVLAGSTLAVYGDDINGTQATFFQLLATDGTTCVVQGTCGAAPSAADIQIPTGVSLSVGLILGTQLTIGPIQISVRNP